MPKVTAEANTAIISAPEPVITRLQLHKPIAVVGDAWTAIDSMRHRATFTKTAEGVEVRTAPKFNAVSGNFLLVPWSNISAIQYACASGS